MTSFRYHIAPERFTPLPPEDTLLVVEADEPFDALAALAKLGAEGLLPNVPGGTYWIRFILSHNNGKIQVASVPFTVEDTIPVDWR